MARILVVDDEHFMRNFMRRVLERAGHEVDEADGGHEAMERLRESKFDVLLTDLLMPTGRGMESITACRREFPDTAIIAISAVGAYLSIAERLGARRTLEKPFNNRELLDAVDACLDKQDD